jgi:hemerythrin-like domain-containing protein
VKNKESIIDYACRSLDEQRSHTDLTIESLIILCESAMSQKERKQMIKEWREMRLLPNGK